MSTCPRSSRPRVLLLGMVCGVAVAVAGAAPGAAAVSVTEPAPGATIQGVVRVSLVVPHGQRVRETRLLAGRRQIVRALSYGRGVGVRALVNTRMLGNGSRVLSVVTSRADGARSVVRRRVNVANPSAMSLGPIDRAGARLDARAPCYRFAIPRAITRGASPIRFQFTGVAGNRARKVDLLLDGTLVGRVFLRPGALSTITVYVGGARLRAGAHLLRARVTEAGRVRTFRAAFAVGPNSQGSPVSVPAGSGAAPGAIPIVTVPLAPGATPRTTPRPTPPPGGTAPPPTPSPPVVAPGSSLPGRIVWTSDFETGDTSQWRNSSGNPGTPQAAAPDRVRVVTSPVAQGRYAGRFEVRPGDTAARGNRAEVVMSQFDEKEGDERWYQWYTMFDPSYSAPDWQIFTQWHAEAGGTPPPLRFVAEDGRIELITNGGAFTRHWNAPLVKGQWLLFRLHVKWSTNKSVGFVELYYNNQLVLPRTPAATLLPSSPTNYFKQGLYRRPGTPGTSIVYHDGFQASQVN